MIDVLERRRMLSAAVAGKVLSIVGTSGDDVYTVGISGGRVVVVENGDSTSFTGVRSINAALGNGNDKITIDSSIVVNTTLQGGAGNDTIDGAAGSNVINGNDGNDVLHGNDAVDAVLGGSGNDILVGGAGDDYLDGQSGADTVSYEARAVSVTAHIDITYVVADPTGVDPSLYPSYGGSGGQAGEKDTFKSVETLLGGSANDQLYTQLDGDLDQSDSSYPSTKINIASIDGKGGNDRMLVIGEASESTSNNSLYTLFVPTLQGGAGNDTFTFLGHSKAHFLGNDGNDVFNFAYDDSSIDTIDGGAGSDDQRITLQTGSGAMLSQMGNAIENALIDSIAVTTFRGNSQGNNILIKQADDLTVYGGGGNDRIELATSAADLAATIYGEAGNDTLIDSSAGVTSDLFDGGAGNDTVSYALRTKSITGSMTVTRAWNAGAISTTFTGQGGALNESDEYASIETLMGSQGDDTLTATVDFDPTGVPSAAALGSAYGFALDGSVGDDTITLQGLDSKSGLASSEIALMRPTLRGSAGDDTLLPIGFSTARWEGGTDNDTLEPADNTSYYYADGGEGIDTENIAVTTGYTVNTLAPNFENAEISSAFVPAFYGNALGNKITVHADAPMAIRGQGGNDAINVTSDSGVATTVYGGEGNDTIDSEGSDGVMRAYGEAGNDVLRGGDGLNDTLDGGIGEDALFGRGGNDSMVGGDGNDYFEGGRGNDILLGQGGNDTLRGNLGSDSVDGGAGDDTFYVRDNDLDSVYGGDGTDAVQRDTAEEIVSSCETTLP